MADTLIRGLTVRPPWSGAIAHANKRVENRRWLTYYRGLIAIHAAAAIGRLPAHPGGPVTVIDPLAALCPACLAEPGEQCIATSSDLPREHPHRLRGLAAAEQMRRCPSCAGSGWGGSGRGAVSPDGVVCPVCRVPAGAACTEAGAARGMLHEVRVRAAGLGLEPCGVCGGIGWEPAAADHRPVVSVDPAVRFGRPHMRGISCEVLAGGVYGGDTCGDVAAVYGLTRAEVLTACWWAGLEGPPKWRRRWAAWAAGVHPELAKRAYDAIPDPPAYEESRNA